MDNEILAELKKINLQLAKITQFLNTNGLQGATHNNQTKSASRDIASEVQAKIAEARRRAEGSMPGMQLGAMPEFGAE